MLFTPALTIIRQRRHVLATAISAALYTLAWAPAAGAQTDAEPIAGQPLSAQDCALIRDGLQRLACFDEVYQPDLARDNASTEQRQRIESATEALPPSKRNIKRGLNSPEADDETAVMSSILDRYLEAEEALFSFSGSFIRHRPNYILPVTWSDHPNQAPTSPRLGVTGYDYDLKQEEAKYQISFKVPLLTGFMDKRTTLWFGYTQVSFWQLYNQDESAPFRETNYEPELFLRYQPDWNIGPGRLDTLYVGINHQSNGQAEPRSRSWNRIVGMGTYTYKRWLFMVKPWIRLPEGNTDDNDDIESYLGHGSYHAVYKLTEDRTFSLKLLNNLRTSDNKTSVEFGYSFPMGDTIKGFVHYYNGYGESLIDYNVRIQRVGVGIMLNDWL
jgi:phospholipase A1